MNREDTLLYLAENIEDWPKDEQPFTGLGGRFVIYKGIIPKVNYLVYGVDGFEITAYEWLQKRKELVLDKEGKQ